MSEPKTMNWVDRRARMENGIPEFWNLFAIHTEQVASSFNRGYSNKQNATASAKRISDCIHLTYESKSSQLEAIDVCLDKVTRRIFSRIEGAEQVSLTFNSDADGKPVLVDGDGNEITKDQASEFFLKTFLRL
jgi:hypothetical protein